MPERRHPHKDSSDEFAHLIEAKIDGRRDEPLSREFDEDEDILDCRREPITRRLENVPMRTRTPFSMAIFDGRRPRRATSRRPGQAVEVPSQGLVEVAIAQTRAQISAEQPQSKRRKPKTMPVISAVDDIARISTQIGSEVPAYVIADDLPIKAVIRAVFGKVAPNRTQTATNTANIPPHFDHYFQHFTPWTLHQNLSGRGTRRAWQGNAEIWDNYRSLFRVTAELGPRMQQLRDAMAELAINRGAESYQAPLDVGSSTLLWHGIDEDETTPAGIHSFERLDGSGTYAIFARQISGSPTLEITP